MGFSVKLLQLYELDDVPRDTRTILQFHMKLFLCILKSTYNTYFYV